MLLKDALVPNETCFIEPNADEMIWLRRNIKCNDSRNALAIHDIMNLPCPRLIEAHT